MLRLIKFFLMKRIRDVWLYDMQGRLLTHVRRVVSMSVSHLHRGVYVAKARKGKETASLKFSLP